MKQIANLLIELLLSVVMLTSCAVESPTAREVADGMNIGINLGNTLEGHYTDGTDTFDWVYKIGKNTPADYENSWGGGHPTELTIKGMKECGFDTVRIPVFLGETSCIYHDDRMASDNRIIETSPECLDHILRRIYDRGYVAVLWTQDSSYYNRETGEMEEKENGEVILKLAEELR